MSSRLPEMIPEAYAATLQIVSDGVWDWDAQSNYVYRNPSWYLMLDYSIDALANTVFTWENVIHPEDFERVMGHFDAFINRQNNEYKIQYRCRKRNGEYIWIEDRAVIVKTDDVGNVLRVVGAHRDLTKERALQEEAEQHNLSLQEIVNAQTEKLTEVNNLLAQKVKEVELLAITDPLTNLFNRLHFDKTLKTECARAIRFNEPLSLVAMDIDNLKPINDQYGHAQGDLALIEVANIIKQNCREIDIAVRWGGDEFMLFLPQTNLDQALQVAEKLKELIAGITVADEITLSCSFGVAQHNKNEDVNNFVQRADRALYRAKEQGRNRVDSFEFNSNL